MDPMEQLAEQRMREAQARGEFEGLPGAGGALPLDDDPLMPEHLRMAYRVLRNANCLPPELERRREINQLEELLAHVDDAHTPTAREARRRLTALRQQVEAQRGGTAPLWADPAYQSRLAEHMARARHTPGDGGD
ncbi:hypothetical protein KBTX_01043 [wastewater metagenome]|uniref:DnaJ homologue subfamily C member 28 conserved domain-containing protein n=2 Tax=unclassified sequences TaxID=12908 RepID=A0A5B8RD77_9ZZZZ|nr:MULTISPECIES: DnaJ family domain-containing protein [Arhodomonas]MCS4503199.1 DUF1992 domain-containing protein [Arhodomonas aquaeolei]QEA04735.1 hypothetical protein KBTEX_01043 [uncultured organism]